MRPIVVEEIEIVDVDEGHIDQLKVLKHSGSSPFKIKKRVAVDGNVSSTESSQLEFEDV